MNEENIPPKQTSETDACLASRFGSFQGRRWINCAHQGPLPTVAIESAQQAIEWKASPNQLTVERFQEVPAQLRSRLAELVNADAEQIVLANSASYGLHLLANGISWNAGDEVLLVENDFPSNILPWLGLEKRGVTTRRVSGQHPLLEPGELQAAIRPETRVFCTTWVHSFSGYAADIDLLGEVCRANNVTFVVNGSQAIGNRCFDATRSPVDALVSVGFKWLCGPYGTGFCFLQPSLLESLEYNQNYWLSMMTSEDLGRDRLSVDLPKVQATARRYDIFGTANFFNFLPWTASIDLLIDHGIGVIAEYDQNLVQRLIDGLSPTRYSIVSPTDTARRSNLVYVSHREPQRNATLFQELKAAQIDISFRAGKLRFSPHIYNTAEDIDAAVEVLKDRG